MHQRHYALGIMLAVGIVMLGSGLVGCGAGSDTKNTTAINVPAPTFSPASASVGPNTVVTFTVVDGTNPIAVAVLQNPSGGGSLTFDPATRQGSYTTGATTGVTDRLEATDAEGRTAVLAIAVIDPGSVPLVFSPSTATADPDGTVTFSVTGGADPIQVGINNWSELQSYGGTAPAGGLSSILSFNAATRQGSYTVGPTGPATDKLTAWDSGTQSATLTITVSDPGGPPPPGASNYTTLDNTDRFYLRVDHDENGNGTPDFDEVLNDAGVGSQRDAILNAFLGLLWERYDNNANGTLATNGFKISHSDQQPSHGRAGNGSQETYGPSDDLYNQIAFRKIGSGQPSGVLGVNNLDANGNPRVENNLRSTYLGIFVDHTISASSSVSNYEELLATVTAHEIGHGLGLQHHSNSTYIMYGAAKSYDPQTEFQPSYKTYFNGGALPGPNR